MRYDIKLTIAHDYTNPAVGGRHIVCLQPRTGEAGQEVVASQLIITPRPTERLDRSDFFGNPITEFAFRDPIDGVSVTLQARVVRADQKQGDAQASTTFVALPDSLRQCRDMGPASPLHFLAPSTRVPRDAAMTRYLRALIRPGMTVAQIATVLTATLHSDMRFDPKATTVNTPAKEAFAKRHGVCQDFSHIMITCLRGVGIPAGYVSGYLRTLPPPGKPRLEGADAMHAWVQVWCGPAAGWLDFDPTNNCRAAGDHIVVARGRDYSDVAPVKGTMRIAGGQKSLQSVDVIPLTETAAHL